MQKFRKARHMSVGHGDLVEIKFEFPRGEQPFRATIIGVESRYGLINGGTREQAPLLTYVRKGSEEKQYCDASFVTRVIEKAQHGKCNIFAEDIAKRGAVVQYHPRGIVAGTLVELFIWGLAKLNRELILPLRDDRDTHRLYFATSTGLVSAETFKVDGRELHTGLYCVHAKPFLRWVKQNASRLCSSKDEVRRAETLVNHELENDYRDDIERDLGPDFEMSCEPDGDDPHGVDWLQDDELLPSQADCGGEWPDYDPRCGVDWSDERW